MAHPTTNEARPFHKAIFLSLLAFALAFVLRSLSEATERKPFANSRFALAVLVVPLVARRTLEALSELAAFLTFSLSFRILPLAFVLAFDPVHVHRRRTMRISWVGIFIKTDRFHHIFSAPSGRGALELQKNLSKLGISCAVIYLELEVPFHIGGKATEKSPDFQIVGVGLRTGPLILRNQFFESECIL